MELVRTAAKVDSMFVTATTLDLGRKCHWFSRSVLIEKGEDQNKIDLPLGVGRLMILDTKPTSFDAYPEHYRPCFINACYDNVVGSP